MRIDAVFGPTTATPALIAGRVVAVIDVLRASTSIAVALGNGARNVVPLESADEVITRAKQFDKREVRLAGERRMRMVPGFDWGIRRASSLARPSRARRYCSRPPMARRPCSGCRARATSSSHRT